MYRLWVTYKDDEDCDITYRANKDYFDNDGMWYTYEQILELSKNFVGRDDISDVFVEDMTTGEFIDIDKFERGE